MNRADGVTGLRISIPEVVCLDKRNTDHCLCSVRASQSEARATLWLAARGHRHSVSSHLTSRVIPNGL